MSKDREKDFDAFKDTGENYQTELWNFVISEKDEALASLRERLARQDHSPGQLIAASDNPDELLNSLTTSYNAHGHSRRMPRVREIFSGMEPFIISCNALARTQTVAPLFWGSLALVFQAVLRFATFWEDLKSMLEAMSTTLPRAHEYTTILRTPRLHTALRDVYRTVIDACLVILECLLSKQCFAAVKLQWTKLISEHQRTLRRLAAANSEFEKEVQLAEVQEGSRRHQEILALLRPSLPTQSLKTNISLPRNTRFSGHEDTLELLHSILEPSFEGESSSEWAFCSCLIHAIGGTGKTELALEYAYRFRANYTCIFWLRSQTRALLQESFIQAISELDIPNLKNETPSRQVELGLKWFRSTGQTWLLIYDNAEDINVLREFWPAGFHGAIIVTSQNPSIGHLTANDILLRTLRPSEGATLIQNYLNRGSSEAASAEELSRILGGHALAIVHFTGHVSRSQCLIEEITKGFSKRLESSTVWKTDRENISVMTRAYAHTLETVWNVAFERLSSDANILLEWIAFLDPDQIPTDLFIEPSDNARPGTSGGGWGYWDSTRFNNAVEVLRDRNLVERYGQDADDSLRTHRVLQRCILQRLDGEPEKRLTRFMEVVSILRKALPEANPISRGDRSHAWRFARYLPQIERLHSNYVASEPKIQGSMEYATILDDMSYYAMTQEDNSLSQKLAMTGIQICENEIDSHPDNIEAKTLLPNLLALLAAALNFCGATGREEALQITRRVLKLRQEELADIPEKDWTDLQAVNYARAHNDLSWQLLEVNKPEEAAPLFKVAIAIYQRTNNKLRLASATGTQTLVLATQQMKDQVREQGSSVKKTVEEMVGTKDALTLMVTFELANAHFTIGDVGAACEMMEAVFRQRSISLGNTNDRTLCSQYFLSNLGDLEGAETNLREILKNGSVTNYWREEDIARAKFRLFLVLRAQNHLDEASQIFKEINQFIQELRASSLPKDSYTDQDDMALLDTSVTITHGRTAGLWSAGEFW
ncbi:unnamed protein product [Clonostachys rosea]|uniref:DUF7779 domain-containing protein n=1 Tax=Bionectria ochroleuca TaxID=29856 RepID=A0ABY6U759_BIOOC|nr:unnamed protein product [Clonostachys rosea]